MSENATPTGPKLGRPKKLNTDSIEETQVLPNTDPPAPAAAVYSLPPAEPETSATEQPQAPPPRQPETILEEAGTGIKFNLMDESNADKVFAKNSQQFQPETNSIWDGKNETNGDTVTGETKAKEEDPKYNVSAKELEDVADFIIEMMDTGVSFLCARIAEETSSKKFEIEPYKKKKLSTMLSVIMEKRQAGSGLSIEMLFVVMLVLFYVTPLQEAVKIKQRKQEDENNDEPNEISTTEQRRPGRPRKA